MLASDAQSPSHTPEQHSGSVPQTQASQALSSHSLPACALQQSPPGVGVGAGVSVGGAVQGQSARQSVDASAAQVASQIILQQVPSLPQTQA